ncbi:MAG: GNAT family N-acetyltransferase [Betaproteobacteria bacterium]|nr:GNAT family N-acetyltransferase [Betaproteobacteria bacterium]
MDPRYPAHLVHEHRLFDGKTVTIRPIRVSDEAQEREFLDRLSGETLYLRFHKWVHAPSDKLVHFFTDIDYDRHMAFVCAIAHDNGEELVGEARYVVEPGGKSCDFGIVIADGWQKSGIAGLLMDALIRAARERKLETMEGLVLASNTAMLRFARGLGFETESVPGDLTTKLIVKKL